MKDNIIEVLIKRPGEPWAITAVENELRPLQKLVGGYIEQLTYSSDLVALCDEEGCIKGLPHNCELGGINYCGTVLLLGVDGEEFADVPRDVRDALVGRGGILFDI